MTESSVMEKPPCLLTCSMSWGTMDSVLAFLKKVQDVIGQFTDPFRLEDILGYIDTLSVGDAAAKNSGGYRFA